MMHIRKLNRVLYRNIRKLTEQPGSGYFFKANCTFRKECAKIDLILFYNTSEESKMLYFVNDYSEGAHEKVLQNLIDTNMEQLTGYGMDHYCDAAKEKIKKACGCEDAEVFLLTGGTQTNQIVIDTLLQPYEGVVAAKTGHVSTHEAGAIEFTGHKVLELPQTDGKICAADFRELAERFYGDENHEHMVFPGMVYISHPTEYGTLYSRKELEELSAVCREYKMPLYLDGARLIYGIAA